MQELVREAVQTLKPPPKLTISEWADAERRLSPEASAEPGRWISARAEYQGGIMVAVSDPCIEAVVFMKSAQVGATEIVNNVVGYYVRHDPSPILCLQPTLDMAKTWSKDRLMPMVRDTPTLLGSISEKKRAKDSTIFHKVFPGGHLTISGANSPASLASRPIRVLLCDEVDRYPVSAGDEGDPVSLAKKRTTTFWNRKLVITSTPTIKGSSRIEQAYESTDKREYYVPCIHCGEKQTLKWKNVKWEKDKPLTAALYCEVCGAGWSESDKLKAIKKGEWRASGEFRGVAGFRLNELYSPWVAVTDMASNFLEAKKYPETLKTWVNTALGESWQEDQGEGVEYEMVYARKEHYPAPVPVSDVVLTAGIDTQGDRLEVEVVAWGKDYESYSVDFAILEGDPNQPGVWSLLDEYLAQSFKDETGKKHRIQGTCIDSGGAHTQPVYLYCKDRYFKRIFAIKGQAQYGKPIVSKPTRNNAQRCRLYPVGTDTAKERIYSFLKIKDVGPGYCHFPDHYDKEFFKQLTSEKLQVRYVKGRSRKLWVKTRKRNEALDCRIYSLAALEIIGVNLGKLGEAQATKTQEGTGVNYVETKRTIIRPKPKRSFATGWRT